MTVIQNESMDPRVSGSFPVRDRFDMDRERVDALPLLIMEYRRRLKQHWDTVRESEARAEQVSLQAERMSIEKSQEAMDKQKSATRTAAWWQVGAGLGALALGAGFGGAGAVAGRARGAVGDGLRQGVELAMQMQHPVSSSTTAVGQIKSASETWLAEDARMHSDLNKSSGESAARAGGKFQDNREQLLSEYQRLCEELNQSYIAILKSVQF
ncbi:hypothetical protein [Cupriavidus sp. AU9028]|uniref:hypothetical protein n=1 Tax=Cupriavidus sp. AU9028 TaxID=2871157 RepID=UPI001C97393F|nr:hypothetical protein [Cupriavidus sp. AU9028]MBY4897895.1 hypothetical protein [Cupriavidus sp. AU9028]